MCGICGIVHLDGSPIDATSLQALTDGLAHRGPDGGAVAVLGNVGLGHRRLSVIDLSDAASQPMYSEDQKVTMVFNGEIYNFEEIRSALEKKGHRFTSSGDSEVLLKLYMEEGDRCVEKLRGMFAFAIHDRRTDTLLLARDRVGKKPIKYFSNGRTFAFASELKALRVLADCPRGVDEVALHHYLTMMYVPAPNTGIKGIKKLGAASVMTIDLKAGKVGPERKYWSLTCRADESVSLPEWENRIRATLEESVRLRMIADVPVGAFLSGGIDSAAIVALMARHSSRPVKTFSIGSPSETHNELPFAELTAKRLGTDHHPIILEADIVHLLPNLVHTYEEPYADPSAIPTYLIAGATRKEVTVALNGDGGDENFAGYVRYPILQFSLLWQRAPWLFHAGALAGAKLFHRFSDSTLSYRSLRFESTMHLPWPERYLQYISFFTEEEKRGLYKKGFAADFPRTDAWYAARTAAARARAEDPLHQAMNMDLETYLADDLLPKVDLGTMAHGLEARSPLLDHVLLELSAQIPARYKIRGRVTKWIFKDLLKGIVPDETLHKRKTGFRLPLDHWFRTDLKSFVTDRLLDTASPLWAYLDRSAMEVFLRGYFDSRIDMSDHVWSLLWLDEWLRQYA